MLCNIIEHKITPCQTCISKVYLMHGIMRAANHNSGNVSGRKTQEVQSDARSKPASYWRVQVSVQGHLFRLQSLGAGWVHLLVAAFENRGTLHAGGG